MLSPPDGPRKTDRPRCRCGDADLAVPGQAQSASVTLESGYQTQFDCVPQRHTRCQNIRRQTADNFHGPAASPQLFSGGAVIVEQGDGVRLVQTDVFLETYVHADGSKISVTQIPAAAV